MAADGHDGQQQPRASPTVSGRSSSTRKGRAATAAHHSSEYPFDGDDQSSEYAFDCEDNQHGTPVSHHGSWEARWSPSSCSRYSQGLPQFDVANKVTHMATGLSRSSIDRNVTRTNMQKFELNRREACAWARRGEELVKHPLRRPDGGRFSSLREMCRKPHVLLQRMKKYHFLVLDRHKTASGYPELRWDCDLARAESEQAKGRLVLSEVHYVAATVLEDEPDDPHMPGTLLQEFQIVCSGYTMKLTAPSRESMKLWVVGLLHLSRLARKRNVNVMRSTVDDVLWNTIIQEFRRLDQDRSGDISKAELADLIPTLGGNPDTVGQVLSAFDADGNGSLQLQEFARLFQAFAVKEVLAPWFLAYACPLTTDLGMQTMGISEASFLEFLDREQRETGAAGAVFANLQDPHVVSVGGQPHLTELGFSHLLCSSKNPAFDPARRQKVHQDMTQPLSRYWISSSHNTYLQSDQLFGKSSLDQYIEVLLRGCRCVEIDCWDGEDGEPIVTHGYTATSRLMFQDVVRVCRDYGFVASSYPLILSLEVHCGPRQLVRMGQILNDLLGDRLLRLPEGGLAAAELVSPASAMRKVIVKGKVPHDIVVDDVLERTMSTSSSVPTMTFATSRSSSRSHVVAPRRPPRCPLDRARRFLCALATSGPTKPARQRRPSTSSGGEVPPMPFELSPISSRMGRVDSLYLDSTWPTGTSQDTTFTRGSRGSCGSSKSLAPTKTSRGAVSARRLLSRLACGKEGAATFDAAAVQEYARTIYLVARKPPRSGLLEEGFSELLPCNIMSFNEKKAEMLLGRNLDRSREHHCRCLSRVYPMASRTSSTNFDPVPFWLAGVQMVALNYQSMDLPVLLNEGLFRNENGGAGYILKPELPPPQPHLGGCRLSVGVLCGQYLPKPTAVPMGGGVTNPMVRVSICGLDEDRKTVVTRQILDNGFNPRWEENCSFELSQPSLAILVLEVVHTAFRTPSVFGWFKRGRLFLRRQRQRQAKKSGRGRKIGRRLWAPSRRRRRNARAATVERGASSRGGGSSKFPWSGGPEEVVAAAALPVSDLREGLRWAQLLDSRFHPVERCGLLLDIRLRGPWAEERRPGEPQVARMPTANTRPSPTADSSQAQPEMLWTVSGAISI